MKKGNLLYLMVGLIVVIMLGGCATKVKINMLEPAKYHEAALIRTVSVMPLSGPEGDQFAGELEGVIGSIRIKGENFFTLVDRRSLNNVISEMKLMQSGLADQATAVRIGKLIGAQGIYTGTVTAATWNDSHYSASRSKCIERQREDRGSVKKGECIRWWNYEVPCVKRTASFAFTPKLVEVETGRVAFSANYSGSAESSGCQDGTPASGGQELLTKAKDTAKKDFRQSIAPYYVVREVKLMDSTDGITSSEAKDKLKNGIDYAEKRLERACELWKEADRQSPGSVALTYDLGVCAESAGDLDAAQAFYTKADNLLGKPDEDITQALNRVAQGIKKRDQLKKQLGKK